jgi:DNA-binding NtrC family response regulator
MRPRILFVDDDVDVLESLRDALRKDRQRWDFAFATGGDAALAELAQRPCNVVVSDMRMPGMDGAELLTRIKAQHPTVARLVLSGHAEQEAMERAMRVAQEFLSKPCQIAVLRATIERALAGT